MASRPPVYYIIHASEDKQRFVDAFDKKLRENGVDSWYDKWEIKPGDRVVTKIFDGIDKADGFFVVVSKHSANKPWVKEELDAAFLKRIEGKAKLIPIILDDASVPAPLRTTHWQAIQNPAAFDDELKRILAGVHGTPLAPPVQSPPAVVQATPASDALAASLGFQRQDAAAFRIACEMAIEKNSANFMPAAELAERLIALGAAEEDAWESIQFIIEKGWAKGEYTVSSELPIDVSLNPKALEVYGKTVLKTYDDMYRKLAFEMINDKEREFRSDTLAQGLGATHVIVLAALNMMERRGLLSLYGTAGTEAVYVMPKRATLRRELPP